ncbi:putative LPS assembly protein LptD [Allomuricauda sp. SCSIO 65647]|uniref:putative LPS assembly protein LptD n=1 Tax=Allomuricauda sp. SCSIO 65647 TaxID=2908843 RepID=UPI001F3D2108|nr:putative LPS assembly protein LptD [Muricauda sp. SCSIO 65647]UJH66992.1 LPS-assembly protein LptD [Muricauda sp. SCSIO 65647]
MCKFGLQKPSQAITKIGFIALQANKHFFPLLFLLFMGVVASAQEDPIVPLPIKAVKDSIKAPLIPPNFLNDSIPLDSTETDTVPKKKALLLDKIKYKAKDYVRISQTEQKIYLYDEAEIYYQDTELKAGIIVLDYVKNEVYAGRIFNPADSTYSQLPYFKQGDNEVIPDSIRFNFDTQKALIFNSRTEQQAGLGSFGSDAMKVLAEVTKKENDSVYFLKDGKLTTSKDTIDPDYYIRVRKAKFVPGKKIIAGFSNMYIVDVPTPIALPFAYFPLTTGRTAGLIFPTFGNNPQQGYFIQNGGYYFPISDYVDFSILGDFFTNGSYGFRTQSIYTKRYQFRGNINFRFENLVTSQKGFSDFSRTTIYNLQITHSQDPKANPNSRFSASVNLGSSNYFRQSANQVNLANTQNNNLSSSISYSKTFPAYPSVNLSLTATHNQNTNTEAINLTLPTLQASMERIFPFAKRDGLKKGIIQNLNLQYNLRAENRITTTDSLFFTSRMFDDARVGARHTIPLSTNFKVAKYFSVTVGANYEDVWTLETFERGLDPDDPDSNREVVLDTISGFDRYNRYGFSANIGTTLYGTFNFGEDKKIQAIRHVMRPSIGWGYTPSFEQFYDSYTDLDGEEVLYSRFEGTLNGAPSLNKSNSVSFSLQNTLEAKVRDKDSTATEPKKISLLSNLNFATSYNFEADSLKLSPVSFNGGTTILDNKMSINFTGNLDPYAIDNNGRRINTLNINSGGGLFRLTRASLNIGYSLNSETFKKKDKKDTEEEPDGDEYYRATSGGRVDDLFGQGFDTAASQIADKRKNDDDDEEVPIYNTKLPWDLRLAYATTYNNSNRQSEITNNSLMFSGNIELTPKWSLGFSSGYDFKNKGFTLTQFRFQRNLGSFDLRFNWVPFGTNERWDFFIGISSSILQDVKWEQRSQRRLGRR